AYGASVAMSSRAGEGSDDGDHPKSSKLNVDREEARGCESDREPEEGEEIAEHGQVERGGIPILQRAEIRERGRKQEDDQEQGEIRTHSSGRGGGEWNWLRHTTIPTTRAGGG